MSKFAHVFTALKPIFKQQGYKKSGDNFYRLSGDTITAANFKSGPRGFWINFGSKPYTAPEVGKKMTAADLRTSSDHRVALFRNDDGWLYDMGETEMAILIRKINEQLGKSQTEGLK